MGSHMRLAGEGDLQLEGPQWTFALRFYGRPEVAEALLLLQDRVGADVCVVLFALFIARTHRAVVDDSDLADLDAAIADWRREVIWPLRCLRRRLRSGPSPAPAAATQALLQRIKTAEIDAEQIELAVLAQQFYGRPRATNTASVGVTAVLERLVAFFAARCPTSEAGTSGEVGAAVKTLAGAMSRFG
jgi:uncharacterized protein (TIGR02444 family)